MTAADRCPQRGSRPFSGPQAMRIFLCRSRRRLTVFEFTLDLLLEGLDRARG